jgi:amino acid adenylation domain-containing protein
MDLTKIMERLDSFPEQGISIYNGEGRLVRKTYPAVRADVENVITQLRAWGVEEGMRIGILSTNWYEFILYDIALMELRCTSLAFPEEFGNKTRQQLIEDYGLNLLLLAKKDVWPTTTSGQWTAYIDAENASETRIRQASREEFDEEYIPTVAFSSGSSGKIKGMTINPRGVEDWIAKFCDLFEVNNGDSLLVFLPLSSIQQRLMIYAALFYGIDLCLIKPAQLFTAFKDYKPTLFLAPPLLYEGIHTQFVKTVDGMPPVKRNVVHLLRAAARVAPAESLRKRLRQICYGRIYSTLGGRMRAMWTGMAPIRRSTLDFFAEAQIPLFEAYGQTECGLIASNSPLHNRIGSVGKPLDSASVRLADDGEIIVHQPHFQTKRYIFYEENGEAPPYLDAHTLATGDIGRFDDDGYLYLLGRKKEHIVTAQGYKVHPELLEGQINLSADVGQSVVFGNALPYLVALISIDKDKDAQAKQRIERHIAQINQKLPPIGRIQKVHFTHEQFTVDNGLLTRNLKLHRKALLKGFQAELIGETRTAETVGPIYEAPQTETERRLADIWCDVLNVKTVGRQDEFLALGGDSLLATQVLSRVRDAFQIDLPLGTFFETGQLAELAKRIDEFTRTQEDRTEMRIQRAPRDGELPLSYAQQRLWFLRQLEPNNTSYNETAAVRLSGTLDLHALEQAFEQIIARHEILRTTFHSVDGRPFQVINPTSPFSIRLIELHGTSEEERSAEVQRIIAEMARVPFDLERGPLMHVSLMSSTSNPSEHVMTLLMHHIISDGWSQGVLVREVAWLYQSFLEGRPGNMPELEIQYTDFAVWQKQWLQGETLDELFRYWKQQLAGAPPVLELPTDRPHSLDQKHVGGIFHFTVDPKIADRLRTLSRDENVTLFMLLLAAFQVQLSRYTGQDDICVGTPIANRNRAEIEPLIGFFVNTLVLRTELSGDPTFTELLDRVRKVTLGAYEHQDIPFEKIVEELQPDRRLSRTPLFQVMFILQNAPLGALELSGLKLSHLDVEQVTAKFDLTLSYQEADGQLNGMFVYDSDLFDASTVERMIDHCQTLLSAIATDPSRRVSEIPLLSKAERRLLVREWNDTRMQPGPSRCVHELFEEQVARTPEHTAVVDENNRLSYRELDAHANQLAHHLRRLGVRPEVTVGILLERSVNGMVGILGVLKAGGAYVPLEPMHPVDRWQRIIADAGVAVVISEQRFARHLPNDVARLVLLDADAEALARESSEPVESAGDPQNLAYVIYTSGSTGQPKGVAVEHRQLYNYLRGIESRLAFRPASSYAAVSTLAADLGHTIIFGALCVGGGATLHLISQERTGDAEALSDYFARHEIDYLKIVPSHLRALLQIGGQVIPRRGIVLGGEAFTVDLAQAIAGTSPEIDIFNHYGPTETTVGVLTHHVAPDGPFTKSGTIPLGRPLPNTRLYVLDRTLQPVPVGVAGELFIGGAGVTRGYLNAPGSTAEKFIPDAFSDEPGARMYRTGDLVRYLSSGHMEFLGRADDQVKIRGYRIEPVEVEEALRQHEAVRAAIVMAYGDNGADKRLAAYVMPAPGCELTASDLRDFARDHLPDFMIPSLWVMLDELPLTPNGKVDRRALPPPEDLRPQTESIYVAPRTVDEEILARLWADILRVEQVGINDNFFDLGGHSLLATQLVSHIRKRLEVEMPLRAVFEEPTVAGQAARIEALRWGTQELQAVAASADGEREVGEL